MRQPTIVTGINLGLIVLLVAASNGSAQTSTSDTAVLAAGPTENRQHSLAQSSTPDDNRAPGIGSSTHSSADSAAPSNNVSASQSSTSGDSPGQSAAAPSASTQKSPGTSAAKVVKDLPNFHEVHPYLYRGGEPTQAGLEKLKSMGVSTLIDLRAPTEKALDEKRAASKLGMHYINLVMDSRAPTEKQVQTMLSNIDQAKKKYEQGKKDSAVFVHCAHGSDRTGCMIGIWRVARENWDYPTTYKEMRQYYFGPKFTKLSGAVEKYAAANSDPSKSDSSKSTSPIQPPTN